MVPAEAVGADASEGDIRGRRTRILIRKKKKKKKKTSDQGDRVSK